MNVNKEDLEKATKEILEACNRRVKNINGKEDPTEGIKVFHKYFNPENPIFDINKPLHGQKLWNALAFTTFFGRIEESRALMSLGANPNQSLNDNLSVLHIAANEGKQSLCSSFLKNGANVNAQTTKGCTPMMSACENGHLDTVKVMLQYKPNIMLLDAEKNTCLDYGLKNGHRNVIRFIEYFHLQHKIPLKSANLVTPKKVTKI